MTPELQAIGERLAEKLGWACDPWAPHALYSEGVRRGNPSDPAECFKLAAEFKIDLRYTSDDVSTSYFYENGSYHYGDLIQHNDTTTGRLHAAIEATLLAIEMIIDAREMKDAKNS
jgi:hypothetical protein